MAGLAAALRLAEAGCPVTILEARHRVGGRIFTLRPAGCDLPIELGAEFIHGLAPEIWEPLQAAGSAITEVEGESWCVTHGKLLPCQFFSQVDAIFDKMDDRSADESFLRFLRRNFPDSADDVKLQEAKRRAIEYVSGFNAADPALVGVHWLVRGMQAEERIDGQRAFRTRNGYDQLVKIFCRKLERLEVKIHTNTVVEQVRWQRSKIEINAQTAEGPRRFAAGRVVVTLPLAVLKAKAGELGGVRFEPSLPQDKMLAMDKLEMGKVIRVVFRFRQRFWDRVSSVHASDRTLSNLSFLLSQDELFPTWWTALPSKAPMLTGWAPFRSAEQLSGRDKAWVIEQGLKTLSELLAVGPQPLRDLLEDAYFHDWQNDAFARGAYSYGKVGAANAQETLAAALDDVLYFAGEHTDTAGHNGTVHGAIASGYRAARQILSSPD
jgi:monoamine oxidase